MKIAVIDLCDTLYDSNTTFDFLNYYFKDQKEVYKIKKIERIYFIQNRE